MYFSRAVVEGCEHLQKLCRYVGVVLLTLEGRPHHFQYRGKGDKFYCNWCLGTLQGAPESRRSLRNFAVTHKQRAGLFGQHTLSHTCVLEQRSAGASNLLSYVSLELKTTPGWMQQVSPSHTVLGLHFHLVRSALEH